MYPPLIAVITIQSLSFSLKAALDSLHSSFSCSHISVPRLGSTVSHSPVEDLYVPIKNETFKYDLDSLKVNMECYMLCLLANPFSNVNMGEMKYKRVTSSP